MTHICVSRLTITGSDNGLSPDRRQAIIWTNAGLLLIGPLGTNFSEILIEIITFSFKKMRLKVWSAKRRPFCLGLNVLTYLIYRRDLQWCIPCIQVEVRQNRFVAGPILAVYDMLISINGTWNQLVSHRQYKCWHQLDTKLAATTHLCKQANITYTTKLTPPEQHFVNTLTLVWYFE